MKNFISAWHNQSRNKIVVWESLGSPRQRVRREIDTSYYFYVPDRLGEFKSLNDENLTRVTCSSLAEYEQELQRYSTKYESDFSPLERMFQDNYAGLPPPELIIGYLDIETDSDPKIGFSSPKNPYAIINALTLIKSNGKIFTIAIPPVDLLQEIGLEDLRTAIQTMEGLEHVTLVATEKKLLELFLNELHEVDVVTGWNSDFFDMPYIGKRIELVLGPQALVRLSFEGCRGPKWSERARFKTSKEKELVLDLVSRVHLDYMQLFKKFNLTTRQSFSLGAVCLTELGETKLEYEGTLAELYNNDFFKFVLYNIHDSRLLERLEAKFKYIELSNRMVHEGTVNFNHIFGSVHIIDSMITNFAHLTKKQIVNDRITRTAGEPVEGAIVMTPNPGFYKWIGSCDINSLYPSVIRGLGLSPEKIIGQLNDHEAGWRLFSKGMNGDEAALASTVSLSLDGELEPIQLEVRDLVALCKQEKYAISGFGTILDQGHSQGILPAVLTYWFNGRKEMQAKKKQANKLADSILKQGIKLDAMNYVALTS